LSNPTANAGTPSAPPKYKRKISNFLIDKKLQLRYIIVVLLVSALIAGALGYLIYQQEHKASLALNADLEAIGLGEVAKDLGAKDSALIYRMIAVGLGLAGILTFFLMVMTHKVAGPLFKISMYFERMAAGRLSNVTPLRDGDMLQTFYGEFSAAHHAVRAQQTEDVAQMVVIAERLQTSDSDAVKSAAVRLAAHATERQQLLQ
jgi:hypothetical protein